MIFSKRLPKRCRHGRSPYGHRGGKSSADKSQTRCKSSPEPLDSSRVKFWLDGPCPATVTVDDLASHRRRRVPRESSDETPETNEGSFSHLKTEYTKNFIEYPLDAILEAYHGTLMDSWFRKIRAKRRKSSDVKGCNQNFGKLGQVESEQHEQFVAHEGASRAELQRKNTLLHMEGEFSQEGSEQQCSYRGYDNVERTEPIKQHSNLKMEGDMETSTEQHDQFGPKAMGEKAQLLRRGTNIQISGDDMDMRTENHDQFVGYDHPQRGEQLRHPGTLAMEGEMEMKPEYNDQFRDHNTQRPLFPRPKTHLQTEGEFDPSTEKREHFLKFEAARPLFPRPQTHLHAEGEFESTTEKGEHFVEFHANRPYFPRPRTHLQPEGEFDSTTEQGENFVEFDANRPFFPRPQTHLQTEGEFDSTTEQGENFVDFDANRPFFPRPMTHLQTEGEFVGSTEKGENFQDFKAGRPYFPRPKTTLQTEGEFEATSEQKSEFKDIPTPQKTEATRPLTSLRLEGRIEADPEYRSTFINHPRERAIAGKIPDRLRRPSGSGYKGKMSENRENFVRHGTVKSGKNRPKTHLRTEGGFYGDSEYTANYQDRPEEKNFASRKPCKEGPDHINFDGYNNKAFQVLSVSPNNSGNANMRSQEGSVNEDDKRPSYRLEVCPADGNKTSDDKSFVVISDANNNIQPQSNWTTSTERRRNKNKWVPSWAGEDKK